VPRVGSATRVDACRQTRVAKPTRGTVERLHAIALLSFAALIDPGAKAV